ncbi:MAG TPA: BrnA antitoxin family protein [Stellaceae bacterium]
MLDFFRRSGKGSQSRINAVLRAHMIGMRGRAKRPGE